MDVESEIKILKTEVRNIKSLGKMILGLTGASFLGIMIQTIAILNEVLK